MARKKKDKIDISRVDELTHNPFAGLGDRFGVQTTESSEEKVPTAEKPGQSKQPMLLIRKEKRKGGKAVTCIYHLESDPKGWLKKMKQRFATGGTVDEGVLALQGDFRDQVKAWLEENGFRCRLGN